MVGGVGVVRGSPAPCRCPALTRGIVSCCHVTTPKLVAFDGGGCVRVSAAEGHAQDR